MYKLRHIYYYIVGQMVIFLPLKFSYMLVEGPLKVFYTFKINGKSLHGPVRGLNQTLNRINILLILLSNGECTIKD